MDNQVFIGLTGGIGSGKSTVADLIRGLGVAVVDADQISRELTQANGLAITAIREHFGDEVIDEHNALNRAVMRQKVFNHPDAKQVLEGIMHPLIREQMIAQALSATQSPYIVFDIPLLIEGIKRYHHWLSRICVIDCEVETQIQRVQQRNALDRETILKIIQSQASRELRQHYADDIIFNGETVSLDNLREQVYNLHKNWLKLKK